MSIYLSIYLSIYRCYYKNANICMDVYIYIADQPEVARGRLVQQLPDQSQS